ncbi:hypothetical protein ASPVEDRAFT_64123 [Aspergillus versicolor CBS 583.65]|uniref:AB hydrolase-1 domain-containing protein n=1 Tax=Aspergillus versicolor CBS 583.65 TaxID=1036611 RepID=A0A1L9PTD8_ASPVE|nr:uncharacterized protein ASPVEDRAFT_64123 [Aspergillus versicolor CBS 583.65]OJJ04810.1 hypothetical protein ASPVEDRAFT_64123 [Aspergillus versicolor CBS 583.65]
MVPLFLLSLVSFSSAAAPSIQWKNCTLENFPALSNIGLPAEYAPLLGPAPGLDCAELQVPLDWSRPHGDTITLGMSRYRAPGSGKHKGSIIYNPGGPGGVASISSMAQAIGIPFYTNGTTQNYDVIGLDLRGIGLSTPVKCDPTLYNKRASLFPSTEAEFKALVDSNRAFGESCRNKTGALFYNLDTASVARDLEAVRIALREDKLNLIGLSYGTQIGAQYAELYPEHVGRLVLDGNVDHSQTETTALQTESSTYEDVLNHFFCLGQNLPEIFDDLVALADASPIPAPGCRGNQSTCRPFVTGEDIRLNVQGNGYLNFVEPVSGRGTSGWANLAQVLNETIAGNATGLSSTIATSETDPSYPSLAVGCLDWSHSSTTLSQLKYKSQLGHYLAPHTKGATQSYLYEAGCIGWPAPVKNPPHTLNQTAMAKAPPILMVNAFHDPETSYVWAHGLLAQIPSAVLLTRDGSGHTSYSLGGAASKAIDAFLANGTLPAPNTIVDS